MPANPCPNREMNEQQCKCTATDCERHGACCECLRAHLADGSLPACVREVAQMK